MCNFAIITIQLFSVLLIHLTNTGSLAVYVWQRKEESFQPDCSHFVYKILSSPNIPFPDLSTISSSQYSLCSLHLIPVSYSMIFHVKIVKCFFFCWIYLLPCNVFFLFYFFILFLSNMNVVVEKFIPESLHENVQHEHV